MQSRAASDASQSSPAGTGLTRRTAIVAAAASASGLLAACTTPQLPAAPSTATSIVTAPTGTPSTSPSTSLPPPSAAAAPSPALVRVPAPQNVITGLPGEGNLLAWTVDDGTDPSVVAAYAEFAATTGARLTLFATCVYPAWERNVQALKPLVDSGQVQLANHTWSHPDLTSLTHQGVVDELQRAHDRIGELFGVDARPFFRPPYGYYNEHVLQAAASIGYTTPALWYGSLADSAPLTEQQIIDNAKQWFLPQHIVIGHLNFDPVTRVFPELRALIRERALTTVTLNDVFSSNFHP
ncbi:polysaccharide deacetylase family protein [Arthrobacter tecti]